MNLYSERMREPETYGDIVLHTSELHLLETIGNNSGIRTTEIAEKMGLTKGRVSQLTKNLLKRKLIESESGGDNRKEVFFSLTKTGQKIHSEHIKRDRKIVKPIIEYLDTLKDDQKAVIDRVIDVGLRQLDDSLKD